MSMIDGIGDEVVYFLLFSSVAVVVIFAWLTTDINRQVYNLARPLYIVETRRRDTARVLTNHTESATIYVGRQTIVEPDIGIDNAADTDATENIATEAVLSDDQRAIIEAMDASDNEELRQRRLAYYRRENIPLEEDDDNSSDPSLTSNSSGEQTPVSPTETNIESVDNSTIGSQGEHLNAEDVISVKLKYINDDLRTVVANLSETLGDFKRKHFDNELNSNKRVRLIFNGRMLQTETSSLRACGFFNNCVVHCLIQQQPQNVNSNDHSDNIGSQGYNNNNNQRDWDLGNLLLGTVTVSLASAWYFRYYYPQLFTVTATIALVVLTGIFSVVSFGMYFPEIRAQDQQRRIIPPILR